MHILYENPIIPPRVAEVFAARMEMLGYVLDHSLDSLKGPFNEVLGLPTESMPPVTMMGRTREVEFDFVTAAACYLGNTLVKHHAGVWKGHCSEKDSLNFYTLWVMFGSYRFYPIVYVSYRVGNGVERTCSVKELLEEMGPSMIDGVDYKTQTHDILMAQGRTVIDNRPWL